MEKNKKAVDIAFDNIKYTVNVPKQKEKKNVLKGVSGVFKSSELTAIMGPSGAGKSSLLNILTGFTQSGVSGNISMGGFESNRKNRKMCSYILQDDNLHPWFTVNEIMIMAARLKISKDKLREKCMSSLIDNVLDLLHLLHTKQTKCSDLSGGQKKRLSIALEMLDNPPILFLDEPTTGLDSLSSAYCVKLLRDLAREGRTIVCTIHQPSATIYEMFDNVYVLADGHCVYQGSADNTVSYLSSLGLECPQYHSSADYMLEVANGEHGNHTEVLANSAKNNQWRSSRMLENNNNNGIEEMEMEQPQKFLKLPSEWTQLWVLVGRCHIQFYRDWTVTHLKLFFHILCAVFVGLIFNDSGDNADKAISNVGSLLIGVLYLWYTTIMPGVLRFPSEISILKKETFNNWYRLRTFYMASLITSTPINILFAGVYSSIAFFMTYQPSEFERYFKFVLIHVLLVMVADGYGVFFGTIFNPINGTFIGAIISCFILAFAGFFVFISHMTRFMYYISFTSVLRYSLEAVVLSVYDNNRSELNCPEKEIYCHYKNPQFIIKELGMVQDNFVFDLLNILLQLFLIKTIGFFALRKRLNSA